MSGADTGCHAQVCSSAHYSTGLSADIRLPVRQETKPTVVVSQSHWLPVRLRILFRRLSVQVELGCGGEVFDLFQRHRDGGALDGGGADDDLLDGGEGDREVGAAVRGVDPAGDGGPVC